MMSWECADNSTDVNQAFENLRPKTVKHREDNINLERRKINKMSEKTCELY